MAVHALWVTSEPPDHRRGGGAIRQAQLIDGLSRVATVDLLLAGRLGDEVTAGTVGEVTELAVPPRRSPVTVTGRRLADLWRVAALRKPAEAADRRHERAVLVARLRAFAAAGRRWDVVHIEHLGLAGVVPTGLAPVLSLDVQNVPSAMADHARALAPGRRQRLLWAGEAAAARRFQGRALGGVDVVSAVSDADVAVLAGSLPRRPAPPGRPAPRFVVVPNGVDADRIRPAPLPPDPRLVFTGTLDFLPNVDGIRWFVADVLPRVRRAVPAATLEIVGRAPVPDVTALASGPGVTLSADVPDVAPHLAAARAAVVPVRIGTGSRLKALEAMAAGRPVAGTSVGLAGLAVESGRHALVADDAEGFAAAVVALLTDDGLAARTAGAGRELVVRRYGWAAIAEEFSAALVGALPRRTAG